MTCRVIVIGGYGLFGGLLSRRLAAHSDLELIIAGRRDEQAQRFVDELQPFAKASITARTLDVHSSRFISQLQATQARLVINTAGPFQGQDYTVARACAQAGVDYVDLADARDFVTGFTAALDKFAREHGVALVTGASSVPALSSAVIDTLSRDLKEIVSIDVSIAPGNRTRRGLATASAILSYCGAPVRVWEDGKWREQRAWRKTVWRRYKSPVGRRPLSLCEVPDLELFPARYPSVKTVVIRAGLELRPLHYMMNLLSWLRGIGLVNDWSRFARPLFSISELFAPFGSDAGAMHVFIQGKDHKGSPSSRNWQLIAADGDGPYVPTLAAAAIVRRYLTAERLPPGAYPCVGVLTLAEFDAEMQGLALQMETFEQ